MASSPPPRSRRPRWPGWTNDPVGGAQAAAALAYGTESIPRVEKITGPGNAYAAAAKQVVSGDVGIDMVAGPSEVCVLADATANPMVVAADLMAQAEHDPLAACYLVTGDADFAREVEAAVGQRRAQSPRADITRASLENEGTIVIAADMDAAVGAVNTVAPEHLELHCADALGLLGQDPQRGSHLRRRLELRAAGRLRRGPQPHPADRGHSDVFQPAVGRGLRQASPPWCATRPPDFWPMRPRRSAWPALKGGGAHGSSAGLRLVARSSWARRR